MPVKKTAISSFSIRTSSNLYYFVWRSLKWPFFRLPFCHDEPHLSKCQALTRLKLCYVLQVSTQAVIKFAAKSLNDLQVQDMKLVDKRKF